MTKSAKRIPAILLLCACIFMLLPFQAHAAASGKMVYNDPTVTVGNNVTVSFTISADVPIAAFQAIITYDSSMLKYISGSGSGLTINGGSGSISMNYAETSNLGTSLSGSFTFQALAVGETTVETASIVRFMDLDEQEINPTHTGTSTVKITAAPTASSEARLASLSVGGGTLSPTFSSDVYEYSTTVENDVTRLVVSASTKDSGASLSVSGQDLSVGNNTVTIKVTAEDGSVKTYTIHVTRQAASAAAATTVEETEELETDPEEEEDILEEEPEEEEAAAIVFAVVDGRMLSVSTSLDGIELPDDFERTAYLFRGDEVEAAVSGIRQLVLLWLTDAEEEDGAFYIYDEEQDDLYPMVELNSGTNQYILLRLYDSSVIPDGFEKTVAVIDDTEVMAWYAALDGEDTPFLLVWAMSRLGETGLYRYDTEEGTIQRYVRETLYEPEEAEEQEEPLESDAEDDERLAELEAQNARLQEELAQANEDQDQARMTNRILIIVACAELLVFVLILIFSRARRRHRGDSESGDDGFGDGDFEDDNYEDDRLEDYDLYDSSDSRVSKNRSKTSTPKSNEGGKRIKKD